MHIRRIIVLFIISVIFNTTLGYAAEGLRSIKIVAKDGEVLEPFGQSWAVVVGIDDYQKVGKLKYAVNDAKAVKQMLQDKYGFAEDHIFTLYDNKATKSGILQILGDELPYKIGDRDRLLVYFAGHGESSLDNGYLIPVDFRQGEYRVTAISMTELKDILKDIKAKQIYMVLDACYSGMFFTTRAAAVDKEHPRYLQEITKRKARQALTAGGKEPVSDGGYKNHSAFTGTFLEALSTGMADYNGDGIITASEINSYIQPKVAELAEQTPEFGNLPGSEGGEFVFIVPSDSSPKQVTAPQPVTQKEEVSAPVVESKEKQIKLVPKNVIMEIKGEGSDILETLLDQKLTEAGWHIYNSQKLDEITGQKNIFTAKEKVARNRGNNEEADDYKKKTEKLEDVTPDLNLAIETSIEFSQDNMGLKSYIAKAILTLNKVSNKEKVVSINRTEKIFGLDQKQAINGKRDDQFTKKLAEPLIDEFINKLTLIFGK
ncbi:MAG: caspase family protein [bacterium]|nr:caspase family protein [bacterium]